MFNPSIFILAVFLALSFCTGCFGQSESPISPVPLVLRVPVEGSFASGETQTFALHLESNQFAAIVLEKKGIDAKLTVKDLKTHLQLLEIDINSGIFATDQALLESENGARDLLISVASYNREYAVSDKFSLSLIELKTPDDRDGKRIAAQAAVLTGVRLLEEDKIESKEKGLNSFKEGLRLARDGSDPLLEEAALWRLQNDYNGISDLTTSLAYGREALAFLPARHHNDYSLAKVKSAIGYSLVNMGESKQGVTTLSEALELARRFGDRQLEIGILIDLSYGYQNLNDNDKGFEYASQSYEISKTVGDRQSQIECLRIMSFVYYNRGDFAKAVEVLNQASIIAQQLNIPLNIALINDELAANLMILGQLQKALDYLRKSLELTRSSGGNKFTEASELSSIAKVYSQMGQNTRALESNRQAARLYDEFGDRDAIFKALNTEGLIYLNLKDFGKAEEVYLKALKLFEQQDNHELRAMIYSSLGVTESGLGRPQSALEAYLKAAQIRGELKFKRLEASSLAAVADSYLTLSQPEKAADAATQALEKSRAVGDRVTESNALYVLARVRRSQNALDASRQLIEDSLKIVESLRSELIGQESRTSFLSTVRDKYDFYIDLLIEMQNLPENKQFGALAFAVTEQARARGLLDLLAEAHFDVEAGISPELKERERGLEARLSALQTQLIQLKSVEQQDQKRIDGLQKEIEKADDEREKLETETKRSNPRYADLKYPSTIDLKQTQAMLDADTVLLEYHCGAQNSYLFAVGKNEFQIYRLAGEKSLRDSVEMLHRSISTPARTALANYLVTGRELYQTLLAPAENLLKTKTKIIVAADGALDYLPFEVLLRNSQTASLDRLPYLVRDFDISYTPSASVLADLKNRDDLPAARPAKSFLAFAAPDYGEKNSAQAINAQNTRSVFGENHVWKLSDLQYAKTEAESIAKLFPAGQSTVFTGAAATEEQVKSTDLLSQYRYLHFAVHGLIDEEQPQFSSLILSLPKPEDQSKIQNPKSKIPEDGLLQTPEIFDLRLRADLVTLSACETGLGQEMRGEGIVGLTRAFFYAGTPSLLVSLWKVDDASTAELMKTFYEQLLQNDRRDKAAALRQSQLRMIAGNRYAHPYYWAAFILQGK